MERKRRARINESLDQLKSLVLEARNEKVRFVRFKVYKCMYTQINYLYTQEIYV